MYITGGVGTQDGCERFNFDYHLPNEDGYQETCASVGMVMWAARMLQVDADGKYADIMERALYNGVISGVSLNGDTFFYANHLACKKRDVFSGCNPESAYVSGASEVVCCVLLSDESCKTD